MYKYTHNEQNNYTKSLELDGNSETLLRQKHQDELESRKKGMHLSVSSAECPLPRHIRFKDPTPLSR